MSINLMARTPTPIYNSVCLCQLYYMSKNPLYLLKGNVCYPDTMYSENFTSVYSPCTFPNLNNSSFRFPAKNNCNWPTNVWDRLGMKFV